VRRLVLTVGKFYILDIFDINKYANNPKVDFLNWSVINAGSFDFGGDARLGPTPPLAPDYWQEARYCCRSLGVPSWKGFEKHTIRLRGCWWPRLAVWRTCLVDDGFSQRWVRGALQGARV
jgi:hypothetical protein